MTKRMSRFVIRILGFGFPWSLVGHWSFTLRRCVHERPDHPVAVGELSPVISGQAGQRCAAPRRIVADEHPFARRWVELDAHHELGRHLRWRYVKRHPLGVAALEGRIRE